MKSGALTRSVADARRLGAEAIVGVICRAAGGARGEAVLQEEITHGTIRDTELTELRDQICWLLADSGYSDAEIAPFVNRSRSAVQEARGRYQARMNADAGLRRQMEWVVGEPHAVAA
jgi:hypothetical protein